MCNLLNQTKTPSQTASNITLKEELYSNQSFKKLYNSISNTNSDQNFIYLTNTKQYLKITIPIQIIYLILLITKQIVKAIIVKSLMEYLNQVAGLFTHQNVTWQQMSNANSPLSINWLTMFQRLQHLFSQRFILVNLYKILASRS